MNVLLLEGEIAEELESCTGSHAQFSGLIILLVGFFLKRTSVLLEDRRLLFTSAYL